MVCYRTWSKSKTMRDGNIDPYTEKQEEIVVEESQEETADEGEEDQAEEEEEANQVNYRETCLEVHPILCKDRELHPLVRERGEFYLDKLREQGITLDDLLSASDE